MEEYLESILNEMMVISNNIEDDVSKNRMKTLIKKVAEMTITDIDETL